MLEASQQGIELRLRPHQSAPLLDEICWYTDRLAEVAQTAGVGLPRPFASGIARVSRKASKDRS